MRKTRLFALMLVLVSLIAVAGTASAAPGGKKASNQSDRHDNSRKYSARLTGAEEVPPVDTEAHGKADYKVSRDGLSLHFKLTVSDIISVTAGHIHSGTLGLNGPVVLNLVSSTACTTRGDRIKCEGTATAANLTGPLTGHPLSDLIALMDEGRAYTNVHTTAHPGGEARGQIHRHGHNH
jgi:CHRD domain-containing protein